MAILIDEEMFRCSRCNNLTFQEISINSYLRKGNKLVPNTAQLALKCTGCEEIFFLTDKLDIQEQA